MNLLSPFHEHAKMNPHDQALWVNGDMWTYQQLAEQVRVVAGWVASTIDRPNPRIGILASRSHTAYVGILAANYAGAAYVPLNVKAPHAYLTNILKAAHLDGLIVDRTGIEILAQASLDALPDAILSPFDTPDDAPRNALVIPPGQLALTQPLANPAKGSPDDTAYLMFTSGTTGTPKGITISVKNIHHLLTTLQNRYQYTPQDRLSQAFELTFDLSVFDIFMALRSGASLHVVPEHQMPMPAHFIQKQQLTSWFSVPSMIGMLKQMNLLRPGAFPSLQLSLFCGEALPEESFRTWRQAAPDSRIENLYGPTEATVACLLQDCDEPNAITPERGIVSIGWPFEGLHAAIVDARGIFLPQGAKGELTIHGPQVASGYLDNQALTEQRFPTLEHPQLGLSCWYLTGDLAYMDEEGRYHFLGRVDNQVQLRGYRVELDEVEHHLRKVSGCDNAVAIFVDHQELWAQEIIGVIQPSPLDSGTVRTQMAQHLPPYMVPKKIVVLDALPHNTSGKIDRKAIKQLLTKSQTKIP